MAKIRQIVEEKLKKQRNKEEQKYGAKKKRE